MSGAWVGRYTTLGVKFRDNSTPAKYELLLVYLARYVTSHPFSVRRYLQRHHFEAWVALAEDFLAELSRSMLRDGLATSY